MEIEGIDWSALPQSNWTIQTTLGFGVSDTIAGLNRHLQRIQRMEKVIAAEIVELEKQWNDAPNEEAAEHGYDPITDERAWAFELERESYGLLAVMISARIEKWYFDLCENRGLEYLTKKGKTHIDIARKSLQEAGIEPKNSAGFQSVERTTLLAHKFKHNGGIADMDVANLYGFTEGEPIEYEKEDWSVLISDARRFIDDLCQLFR